MGSRWVNVDCMRTFPSTRRPPGFKNFLSWNSVKYYALQFTKNAFSFSTLFSQALYSTEPMSWTGSLTEAHAFTSQALSKSFLHLSLVLAREKDNYCPCPKINEKKVCAEQVADQLPMQFRPLVCTQGTKHRGHGITWPWLHSHSEGWAAGRIWRIHSGKYQVLAPQTPNSQKV